MGFVETQLDNDTLMTSFSADELEPRFPRAVAERNKKVALEVIKPLNGINGEDEATSRLVAYLSYARECPSYICSLSSRSQVLRSNPESKHWRNIYELCTFLDQKDLDLPINPQQLQEYTHLNSEASSVKNIFDALVVVGRQIYRRSDGYWFKEYQESQRHNKQVRERLQSILPLSTIARFPDKYEDADNDEEVNINYWRNSLDVKVHVDKLIAQVKEQDSIPSFLKNYESFLEELMYTHTLMCKGTVGNRLYMGVSANRWEAEAIGKLRRKDHVVSVEMPLKLARFVVDKAKEYGDPHKDILDSKINIHTFPDANDIQEYIERMRLALHMVYSADGNEQKINEALALFMGNGLRSQAVPGAWSSLLWMWVNEYRASYGMPRMSHSNHDAFGIQLKPQNFVKYFKEVSAREVGEYGVIHVNMLSEAICNIHRII